MNIDLILKILMLIIIVGISVKLIKFITGFAFKLALIVFALLLIYKMFI